MCFRLQISLLVLSMGMAVAEQEKSPPAPAAKTSIDAVRQDFDAIKALRQPGGQPKGELPRITLPELPPSEREATLWPTDKQSKKGMIEDRKTKNWLIEAMEKPADSGQGNKHSRDRNKTDDDQTLFVNRAESTTEAALTMAAKGEVSADERHGKNTEREPVPPAPNPLAGFMAGWMTSKDYALLQTKGDGAAATNASRTSPADGLPAASGFLSVEPSGMAAIDGATLIPAGGSKRPVSGNPRENPYLQLALPEPAPALLTQPQIVAPSATISTARIMPGPAPALEVPARPNRPDFAKPLTDDKYFKPLKRF